MKTCGAALCARFVAGASCSDVKDECDGEIGLLTRLRYLAPNSSWLCFCGVGVVGARDGGDAGEWPPRKSAQPAILKHRDRARISPPEVSSAIKTCMMCIYSL